MQRGVLSYAGSSVRRIAHCYAVLHLRRHWHAGKSPAYLTMVIVTVRPKSRGNYKGAGMATAPLRILVLPVAPIMFMIRHIIYLFKI